MYIQRPKELFQPCIIKPLDEQEGLIIAIVYNKCACELRVRYFMYGQIFENWFFDFEIELKEPKAKNKDYFKDY